MTTSAEDSAQASTRPKGVAVVTLRLAGLNALLNGAGFGAFTLAAIWHLAHDHTVWYVFEMPTYSHGQFEEHGIDTTVALLLEFLGACLVLEVGGHCCWCRVR